MAVDTLSKRVSALNKSLPIPDGTLDAGDRQHIAWSYSGILASPIFLNLAIVLSRITLRPWVTARAITLKPPGL